jgi:hypothetical protein
MGERLIMIKQKSVATLNNWQPGTEGMGSNYVMPYTEGSIPSAGVNPGADTLNGDPYYLPGSETSGFSDSGVSSSGGSVSFDPSGKLST